MRNQADVNAHRTVYRSNARSNGANIFVPDSLQFDIDADDELPYLEALTMTARKHPYLSLAAIVTLVGTVLSAIVAACVILFTSFFTMYGTMRELQAQQRQFIENQAVITSELKVMRTYNASVLSRQNFIAGLMSPVDQKRLNDFDRANPLYQPPPPRQIIPNDQ